MSSNWLSNKLWPNYTLSSELVSWCRHLLVDSLIARNNLYMRRCQLLSSWNNLNMRSCQLLCYWNNLILSSNWSSLILNLLNRSLSHINLRNLLLNWLMDNLFLYSLIFNSLLESFSGNIINILILKYLRDIFSLILNSIIISDYFFSWYILNTFYSFIFNYSLFIGNIFNSGFSLHNFSVWFYSYTTNMNRLVCISITNLNRLRNDLRLNKLVRLLNNLRIGILNLRRKWILNWKLLNISLFNNLSISLYLLILNWKRSLLNKSLCYNLGSSLNLFLLNWKLLNIRIRCFTNTLSAFDILYLVFSLLMLLPLVLMLIVLL